MDLTVFVGLFKLIHEPLHFLRGENTHKTENAENSTEEEYEPPTDIAAFGLDKSKSDDSYHGKKDGGTQKNQSYCGIRLYSKWQQSPIWFVLTNMQ